MLDDMRNPENRDGRTGTWAYSDSKSVHSQIKCSDDAVEFDGIDFAHAVHEIMIYHRFGSRIVQLFPRAPLQFGYSREHGEEAEIL